MGFPVISSKIKTRPRLPKAKGFFGNSNYFLATYYAENSNENNSVLTDDRLPSSNFKGLRRGVGREIFTIVFSPIVFGLLLSPRKKKKMKIPGGIPGGGGMVTSQIEPCIIDPFIHCRDTQYEVLLVCS